MKLSHIKAIFLKQTMDMSHNIGVIIQFAIYPILLGFMVLAMSANYKENLPTMVMLLSASFIGLIPMLTVRNIIHEDQIQNVLRLLIFSNVKPMEYLLGINISIIAISTCTSFILGLIGGFGGISLLKYVLVMLLGTFTTLVLGCALAIPSSYDAVSGTGIILISLLNSIIPMLGMLNPTIQKASRLLYTCQINNLIGDIYGDNFDWMRMMVIAGNLILFLVVFVVLYKKNRLLI